MVPKETLIFTKEDVDQAGDMLKALVVKMFVENNITYQEFSRRHAAFMAILDVPPSKVAQSRNNLLKAILQRDTMTYRMFEKILKHILGFNLTNITISVRDKNNTPHLVSVDRLTF